MNGLGILTGLAFETALARLVPGAMVACAAGRPDQADRAAGELIAAGCCGLLSFGIAGGIDPALASGDLVIATACNGLAADTAWTDSLRRLFPTANAGPFAGGSRIAATPAAKAALRPAIAVDMETEAVARTAGRAGLPWAALRVIADTAHQTLPALALLPLDKAGQPRLDAVLYSLVRSPRQLPATLSLARATSRARTALKLAALKLATMNRQP